MATSSINIGSKQTVLPTPPDILAMDQYDTRSRMVNIPHNLSLLPGEPITLSVPTGFLTDCKIVVEPNLAQTTNFFHPVIAHVKNSTFMIKNSNTRKNQVTQLKKNCQAVMIHRTDEAKAVHHVHNHLYPVPTAQRSVHEILKDIDNANLSYHE